MFVSNEVTTSSAMHRLDDIAHLNTPIKKIRSQIVIKAMESASLVDVLSCSGIFIVPNMATAYLILHQTETSLL